MELSQEAKDSLNILRDRIDNESTQWTNDEKKIHFPVVYQAITRKVLSLNCDGCRISAMRIIRNYIKFHEPVTCKPTQSVRVQNKEIKTNIVTIVTSNVGTDERTRKELQRTLKDKGVKFKANDNRAKLIELLNS